MSGKVKAPVPKITFSAQQILDCDIGSCSDGGSQYNVYDFLYKSGGAVPFGCNVYRAESLPVHERTCSAFQNCGTYATEKQVVKDFKKTKILEHGQVKGAINMKKEIYARGPIACGIYVTDTFYNNYKGGVYQEKTWLPAINHIVAIVGWGVEEVDGQ